MALQITTVCKHIAEMEVDGVKIAGLGNIPANIHEPYIIPLPNLVTGFTCIRETFGTGSTAKYTVTYNLNYRLCYIPVSETRATNLDHFDDMVSAYGRFIDQAIINDALTGAVDVIPQDTVNFGIVEDPAGNPFWGCDIAIGIVEYVNG